MSMPWVCLLQTLTQDVFNKTSAEWASLEYFKFVNEESIHNQLMINLAGFQTNLHVTANLERVI